MVNWTTPNLNIYIYYLLPGVSPGIYQTIFNEYGSTEFEIILKSKPLTNIFTLNINTTGLNCVYQPPLTPQEILDGYVRPDNVVGSYACFHDTAKNGELYKTGKAFHIYRPLLIDSKGLKSWAGMLIDKGKLILTLDQKYLDAAIYPITIDPTIGHTSIGGSNGNIEDVIAAVKGSNTTAGTVDYLKAYTACTLHTKRIVGNIYTYIADGNGGSPITNGETNSATCPVSTGTWTEMPYVGTKPTISASTYYFVNVWSNASTQGTNQIFYDTDAGNYHYFKSLTYGSGWPDPITGETATSNRVSLYANYTTSAVTTYYRTQSAAINLSPTNLRSMTAVRSSSAAINLASALSRSIISHRVIQDSINFLTYLSKGQEYWRIVIGPINLSPTASRNVESNRINQETITFSTTVLAQRIVQRIENFAISFVSSVLGVMPGFVTVTTTVTTTVGSVISYVQYHYYGVLGLFIGLCALGLVMIWHRRS